MRVLPALLGLLAAGIASNALANDSMATIFEMSATDFSPPQDHELEILLLNARGSDEN